MQKLYLDVLYLLSCAANRKKAEKNKIDNMDLDALYSLCKEHSITALVSSVLTEHLKEKSEQYARWSQEQMKALYRDMNFAAERAKILAFLEENGIWYMPLKGIVLKEYYPHPELREFADNDILFDPEGAEQVKKYMLQNGYTLNDYGGEEYVDEYKKEPCFNFEMHRLLFHQNNAVFFPYYKEVKNRLIKDEGNDYGYHFSDEDFYVFMIAHAYRHYIDSGIGIRALLDIYIFNKAKESTLNYTYIENELKQTDSDSYEKEMRYLAQKVFSGESHEYSLHEMNILEYYFNSKAYGTVENKVTNRMREFTGQDEFTFLSRVKYWWHRVFDSEVNRREFPKLYKSVVLIPLIPLIRSLRGIKKWKKLKTENDRLKELNKE